MDFTDDFLETDIIIRTKTTAMYNGHFVVHGFWETLNDTSVTGFENAAGYSKCEE